MSVNLAVQWTDAIVRFRIGVEFFGSGGLDEDGDCEVRWESGEYVGYTPDGLLCFKLDTVDGKKRWVARDITKMPKHDWDIVGFEPCDRKTAEERGVSMTMHDAQRKFHASKVAS